MLKWQLAGPLHFTLCQRSIFSDYFWKCYWFVYKIFLDLSLYFILQLLTNLDSILKSRDITLPTKVRLVKATVFPVVMYECESWTIKKAEHWRTDAFELLLEKTLGNALNSKEIQPVHPKRKSGLNILWKNWCWSWNSNILATWCEELIHWKRPWCWERLKTEETGATEDEMVDWHHWCDGHMFE